MEKPKKKKREFTTKTHYVECSGCGPLIGKAVDWNYVRRGGRCLKCSLQKLPGTLTEIKVHEGGKIERISNKREN